MYLLIFVGRTVTQNMAHCEFGTTFNGPWLKKVVLHCDRIWAFNCSTVCKLNVSGAQYTE